MLHKIGAANLTDSFPKFEVLMDGINKPLFITHEYYNYAHRGLLYNTAPHVAETGQISGIYCAHFIRIYQFYNLNLPPPPPTPPPPPYSTPPTPDVVKPQLTLKIDRVDKNCQLIISFNMCGYKNSRFKTFK